MAGEVVGAGFNRLIRPDRYSISMTGSLASHLLPLAMDDVDIASSRPIVSLETTRCRDGPPLAVIFPGVMRRRRVVTITAK